MPQSFWIICAVASVFMLSRFSEAFLVLVGTHAGLTPALTPLALVAMNLAYLLSAYPVGKLSDRMREAAICWCWVAQFWLSPTARWRSQRTPVLLIVGALLWGLHMGFTEGVFAAMVANSAPKDLRGSAFGIFNLLRGLVLLVASVAAGRSLGGGRAPGDVWIWQRARCGYRRGTLVSAALLAPSSDAVSVRACMPAGCAAGEARNRFGVSQLCVRSDIFQASLPAVQALLGPQRVRQGPG